MNESDLGVIRKLLAHDLMQVYVRLFLLPAVAWFSVEIFAPFLALMLWSVILAVSLYPLNQWLSLRLHLSEGKAAIVFVVMAFYRGGAYRSFGRFAGRARPGMGHDSGRSAGAGSGG